MVEWNRPVEPTRRRWVWAMVLACPACAGGFALAMGAVFGVTALAMKSVFLGVVALVVAVWWSRNAWQRRGEGCELRSPDEASGRPSGSQAPVE